MNKNSSEQNKTGYVVTMVVSMLLAVVLVLGTPLFNRFIPESKVNNKIEPIQIPTSTMVGASTGGSSF